MYPLCSLTHLPVHCHPPSYVSSPRVGTGSCPSIPAQAGHRVGAHKHLSLEQFAAPELMSRICPHALDLHPVFPDPYVLCDLRQAQPSEPHFSHRGKNRAQHKVRINKYMLVDLGNRARPLDFVRFRHTLAISFPYCHYSASHLNTKKMRLCPPA